MVCRHLVVYLNVVTTTKQLYYTYAQCYTSHDKYTQAHTQNNDKNKTIFKTESHVLLL